MENKKEYISSLLKSGSREDGRGLFDYRNLEVEVNTINQANGSARVKLGETEVLVGVKFDVGTPFPDSPDQGVLMTSAEHSPLASKEFEAGPPSPKAIEFARVVDRVIRESGTIDFGKLVITPGEKVWMVFIDISPINDGGNLFDAAAIGSIVALKNARFPKYDKKKEKVEHRELTKDVIKLEKVPILCTFGKIDDNLFVDPNLSEEAATEARLNIGTIDNGDICAMQKGETGSFTDKEIKQLADEAAKKGKALRKLLKKYL